MAECIAACPWPFHLRCAHCLQTRHTGLMVQTSAEPVPPLPRSRPASGTPQAPARRLRRAAGIALAALVGAAALGWWASNNQGGWLQTLLVRLPGPARISAWLRQPDLSTLPGLPGHLNPWAMLTLEEPDGPLTLWKLGRLEAAPAACMQWLANAPSIVSTPLPDRIAGSAGNAGQCGWQATSRTSGMGELRFSSPFPLACGAMVALARWERHVVQPVAQAQLGVPVVRIEHFGSYACRRIAGSAGPGRLSEHAHANALDVAAFVLQDGRRISVLDDWQMGAGPSAGDRAAVAIESEGDALSDPVDPANPAATGQQKRDPLATSAPAPPAPNPKATFLRQVRDGACQGFRAVLGPDYNAAHRNHFHLDRGPYRVCR